ncbi:MAG TPA: hypothetical protein HA257_03895 [Candidatus Methanoperedenaceae archaeon]|nr:hypothetical protein [Candidatus Methanoperedenaceae archaeon]
MRNWIIPLAILTLILAVSGCNEQQKSAESTAAQLPVKDLPGSIKYIGSPSYESVMSSIARDYGNFSSAGKIVNASQGFYQNKGSIDFNIIVMKFQDKPAAASFVEEFRSGYQEFPYESRFLEESFNGHSALRIKYYAIERGRDEPRYLYIWSNGYLVFLVRGTSDDASLMLSLAKSTGN